VRVVMIGTGKITSGYLAPLFAGAGWEVVLAGRTPSVADRINRCGGHAVRTTGGPDGAERVSTVSGLRAVVVGSAAFDREIAGADLVTASVGVGALGGLAEPLAAALGARPADRPLDVWVVENEACGPVLGSAVRSAAGRAGRVLPPVGFAGGVAHVAVARGSWHDGDRPEFVRDAACLLYVDGDALVTPLPGLPGVEATPHYAARLQEKLYVFNAGHAICAYLGWLRGHRTVADAVRDPLLRPMVAGSLLESRRALLATHPGLGEDLHGPVAEALSRYADDALADPVVRVAREPLRKLGPTDRLLGPVRMVREQTGGEPPYFSLGIAGALLYRGDDAEQTRELRRRLQLEGVRAVLGSVCGLSPTDPFTDAVASRYAGFVLLPDETVFPPAHTGTPVPAAGALR
jgi:mannitol-1-phosphate 5-dehydrogenase